MQSDKLPKMPAPRYYAADHGYTAEQMQAYALVARTAALEEGFDIGFAASGEGWNGEHPGVAYTHPGYAKERTELIEVYEGASDK